LSAIVVTSSLIATGTRFALIGVLAVTLLLAFSMLLDRGKVRNVLLYVLIISVYIVYKVIDFSPMRGRLDPDDLGNNLTDLGGRTPLWQYAIEAFMEAPFVGLGYEGYEKFVLMKEPFFGLPHNFPLEMAAMAGSAGIILVVTVGLTLLWSIFVLGNRMNLEETLIWSVPVMILVFMLNITNLKLFWFLFAYYLTINFGRKKKIVTTKFVV
jgi:O-antigen ligase